MRWALFAVLCVMVSGCVSPETEKELAEAQAKVFAAVAQVEALVNEIKLLKEEFQSGKLDEKTFSEVRNRLESALLGATTAVTEARKEWADVMKSAEEQGDSKWGVFGQVLISLGIFIAGRVLGIPGLASSNGANLLNVGRRLLAGKPDAG